MVVIERLNAENVSLEKLTLVGTGLCDERDLVALARLQHGFDLNVGDLVIADEGDLFDDDLGVLLDLKDDVDFGVVVVEALDLVADLRQVVALLDVEILILVTFRFSVSTLRMVYGLTSTTGFMSSSLKSFKPSNFTSRIVGRSMTTNTRRTPPGAGSVSARTSRKNPWLHTARMSLVTWADSRAGRRAF